MKGDLLRLDPESEKLFDPLTTVIATCLAARLAVGDPVDTEANIREVAQLIADDVLDVFIIRDRTDETRRYAWEK